jgi:hypothetical protein
MLQWTENQCAFPQRSSAFRPTQSFRARSCRAETQCRVILLTIRHFYEDDYDILNNASL